MNSRVWIFISYYSMVLLTKNQPFKLKFTAYWTTRPMPSKFCTRFFIWIGSTGGYIHWRWMWSRQMQNLWWMKSTVIGSSIVGDGNRTCSPCPVNRWCLCKKFTSSYTMVHILHMCTKKSVDINSFCRICFEQRFVLCF